MKKNIDVSFVIPCFRSPVALESQIKKIVDLSNESNYLYEIILVEDFSCDNNKTWELINRIVNIHKNIKAYKLSKNIGQQKALIFGISKTKGDAVITMDDDLQHNIKIIPEMINILNNYDLVIAKLLLRKVNISRKIGSIIVRFLAKKIFALREEIFFSSFRAIKGNIARSSIEMTSNNPVLSFEIMEQTCNLTNISIEQNKRVSGKSNYSIYMLISTFLKLVINYSNFFYTFFLTSSFFATTISLFTLIYYLYKYFNGSIGVQGYASIIIVLTSSVSMIFFGIGIIGYYLFQIQRNLKVKPFTNFSKFIES